MLSGEHEIVSIDFIWVDRDKRVRKVLTEEAIAEKAESIERIGLIHAPVVRRDGKLIAGETRWVACQRLGYTQIPVQWVDELEEDELLAIELEENIKRIDLSWQDQCDAMRKFHELKINTHEGWTQAMTAEAIGLMQNTVSEYLSVAKAISQGDKRVIAAKEFSTAKGVTRRQNARRAQDELVLLSVKDTDAAPAPKPETPIITTSFLEWVETYEGTPFNLIHCDFPYGINANKFAQGSADSYGGYEDTPEHYWALVQGLLSNRERLLGTSGHIIFWFSMQHYHPTLEALREHFWVDAYPLVWHKSDNKGTLPDPERGPRRVYEVAFLASLGDRKIIAPVSNVFSGPTQKSGEHMSEKSEDMLKHFMKMLVDENTRMLDPTCGSASALRAAHSLGAASVLGLEINPEFADLARRAWNGRSKV